MRSHVMWLVTLCCATVLAAPSRADEPTEGPNPCADKLETIDLDSPCLVSLHGYVAQASYENDASQSELEVTYPDFLLHYGAAPNLELQVGFPSEIRSSGASGSSDVSFGAKLGFGEKRSRTGIAVVQTVQSGTNLQSPGPATSVTASLAYALTDNINVVPGYSAAWSRPLNDDGARVPSVATGPSLALEVDLPEASEAELQFALTNARGVENSVSPGLELSLRHFMNKTTAVTAGVERAWGTNTRDSSVEVGGALFF